MCSWWKPTRSTPSSLTGCGVARERPALGIACAQQAKPVFPEGLSGPNSDGLKPIGDFDAICGVSSPGGPTPVNPVDLTRALEELWPFTTMSW